MQQVIINKIRARDKFFELWLQLGQAIANDPTSWHSWQQSMTRAESDLAHQLGTAINELATANDNAAREGF